jgi:tRNA dimethylallyltransferase
MVNKVVVIVGPTASGKSRLAVKLAKKFNGEVVSADSRQVYKEMNLGSGKIEKKEMEGVPHHLIDVASPKKTFTAARYQKLARKKILQILKRGRLPIVCGGTGFYIKSLIDGLRFPQVKPNPRLRKILEKKTAAELFHRLKKVDPARAKSIDPKNKRRLIRALEIVSVLGKVPNQISDPLPYPTLFIGLAKNPETLKRLIKKRLFQRLKRGMLKEIAKLHRQGISWQKLENFGLDYRAGAIFLQGKLNKKEFIQKIIGDSYKYAKRQMTWFKKEERTHWVKNSREAAALIKQFLKN